MSKVKRYISDEEVEVLGKNNIRFSKCYPLVNDSALLEKEVNICAITEVEGDKIKNRIVFKRGKTESSVDCLHTAIYQFKYNPESESGFELISTEQSPELSMKLKPEEHFIALKSVLENLVESGIQNKLMKSFRTEAETGKEPVDMNHMFRQQLAKALVEIAPEETKDLSLFLLDYISSDNPTRFETFSRDFKDVICDYFNGNDIKKLNKINGGVKALDEYLQECIAKKPDLPPDIVRQLSKSKRSYIREIIAGKKDLPEDLVRKLAQDVDEEVRRNIAKRKDLPLDVIRKLADDSSDDIRSIIASRKDVPIEILEKLTKDEDAGVRKTAIKTLEKKK